MAKMKLTTIKSTYSSSEIVADVKNHLKTSSDLYERYIEANASTVVDPVSNAEFLKKGWSNNIVHKDTVVKQVDDGFSFVINLKSAEELIITAALSGDDLYLRPVKLTFSAGKIKFGTVELRYNHFAKYTFPVPKECRKEHLEVVGKVERSHKDTDVVIRSIVSVNKQVLSNYFQENLFELERIKRETQQLLQFLEVHKNPEMLLPASQPRNPIKRAIKKGAKLVAPLFKPVMKSLLLKRIVLKMIRPFTTPQIQFNKYMLEVITLQEKRNDKLEELLLSTINEKRSSGS